VKTVRVFAVLLVCALLAGCASPRHSFSVNGDFEFDFPDDIEELCQKATAESKAHIEDCGTSLQVKAGLTVTKVKGEKKFGDKWGWQAPEWPGIYVAGLCYGKLIKIACHPDTGQEVNYEVLHHENGHYWLITNLGVSMHPAKYDKHFNWSWIDKRLSGTAAEFSVSGQAPDGRVYHIDFINDLGNFTTLNVMHLRTLKWDELRHILEPEESK